MKFLAIVIALVIQAEAIKVKLEEDIKAKWGNSIQKDESDDGN